MHCDASQAVRKVSAEALSGADSWTLSAHKIRGPQGSDVTLGVRHSDGVEQEVVIERATIEIPTVFADNAGVIGLLASILVWVSSYTAYL